MPAKFGSRRTADGTVLVDIRGEVDASQADEILRVVTEALASRPARLMVDLTYMTFIDSVGLGQLVAAQAAASAVGTVLTVTNPSAAMAQVIRVAGLHRLMNHDTAPLTGYPSRPAPRRHG